MPNITTRLGQYCIVHGYEHQEEYLVCDFCNEHKPSVYFHERYYNYGFSRCHYHACNECRESLFGPFRLVDGGIMDRAYESIIDVIYGRTKKKGKEIDYYEAVKITYSESDYIQKYIESEIKDITEINKAFKPIWKFTYSIVNEEKKRVKVVNKDPDKTCNGKL